MQGLPDKGYFGQNSSWTQTPLRAIVLTTVVSILPGLLDFASDIAANAIFSLTAMALDLSYIIPIFLRRVFQDHPDVMFKPGPFYMGDGMLGLAANTICISWTLFVCVIFSFPTVLPVTAANMNYASVSVIRTMNSLTLLPGDNCGRSIPFVVGFHFIRDNPFNHFFSVWYILGGHRHYHGPQSNLKHSQQPVQVAYPEEKKQTA